MKALHISLCLLALAACSPGESAERQPLETAETVQLRSPDVVGPGLSQTQFNTFGLTDQDRQVVITQFSSAEVGISSADEADFLAEVERLRRDPLLRRDFSAAVTEVLRSRPKVRITNNSPSATLSINGGGVRRVQSDVYSIRQGTNTVEMRHGAQQCLRAVYAADAGAYSTVDCTFT